MKYDAEKYQIWQKNCLNMAKKNMKYGAGKMKYCAKNMKYCPEIN